MLTRTLTAVMIVLTLSMAAGDCRAQDSTSTGFTYLGDLNEDGSVNVFDLLAILRVIATGPESERQATIANVDKSDNGKVDIFDLIALLGSFRGSQEPDKIFWGPAELAELSPPHVLPGDTVDVVFNNLGAGSQPQLYLGDSLIEALSFSRGRAKIVAPDSFPGAVLTAVLGSDTLGRKILNLRNTDPPVLYGCQLFPADNPWNQPVEGFPVHPNSDNYIENMAYWAPLHPDMTNSMNYGIPYVGVGAGQSLAPMSFEYADECDPGPYPIPDDAPIEGGPGSTGDRHILVVDSSNCMLYETWSTYPEGHGWHAGSGAMFDLTSNAQRPDGWTSSDAAGLPVLPGLVRYEEVEAGEVNHAIRFTVVNTQKAYVYPATHRASTKTDPNLPPMGLRVRLKAGYDISRFTGQAKIIARALQKYGMIVADNGGDWFFTGGSSTKWNNSDLDQLKVIHGSDFEVVDADMMEVSGRGERYNIRPGIEITFPSPDTTLAAGESITLTARAYDNDGGVALVEFFDGETKLGDGVLTEESYQLAWEPSDAGTHVLTGRATDDKGKTNNSWGITVEVVEAGQ